MEFQVVCLVTRHVLFCMGHLGLEDFIPGTGEGIIKFLDKDLDCWKPGFQVECGGLCWVPAVIHKEGSVAGTGMGGVIVGKLKNDEFVLPVILEAVDKAP